MSLQDSAAIKQAAYDAYDREEAEARKVVS
jgi:hypothetical protein